MKIDIIVGGNYGDEGKGKVVNALFDEYNYDYVFRVNASTNASHCVNLGNGQNYVTKQLPSVFFNNEVKFVVSNGTFLNLIEFENEVKNRPDNNTLKNRVFVASSTPIILPGYIRYNKSDKLRQNIGSTNQGTGIAMMARVAKHSVYLSDIGMCYDIENGTQLLVDKIIKSYEYLKIPYTYQEVIEDAKSLCDSYFALYNVLNKFCVDYAKFIYDLTKTNANVLIEGCNGILLDNINGVIPYTTSCSTTAAALMSYANLPMSYINETYVVMGAYLVCLNKRPFITEFVKNSPEYNTVINEGIEIDNAEMMQRRIGWFDLPTAKRALIGHAKCKLVLSKVDVIKKFDTIKVAMYYTDDNGKQYDILPEMTHLLDSLKPVYKEFNNTEIDSFIEYIESELNVKIAYIGTGSETKNIIKRN